MTFKQKIFTLLRKIPKGKVTTYKELSCAAGKPNAARAVGRILNSNPAPVKIPCHRVVHSDGRIGGYKLGAKKKKALLKSEGIEIRGSKLDLKKYKIVLPKIKQW